MTTVTKLREIENGRQAMYRLDPPITITDFGETKKITHLISSHSVLSGMIDDETMLFQSDRKGNILNYLGLYCMPGHICHDVVVENFLRKNTHE